MSLDILVKGFWHSFHIQDFEALREQRRADNHKLVPQIERLLASGDEMDFIRDHFSDIPKRHGNLNIWRGDMAKFIFEIL